MPRRQVQHHVTGPVEAARGVGGDLAGRPAVGGPGLPGQRRLAGVHAHPVDPAVHPQDRRAAGQRRRQPEQQQIARLRESAEHGHVHACPDLLCAVDGCGPRALAEQMRERARDQGQVSLGGEDHRFVGFRATGGHLGPRGQDHRLGLGRGEPERHRGTGGRGREERNAEQVEEGQLVLLRHPVETVDQLIGHVGDGFDEGDPGIGDVVVAPLGAAPLDVALGIVHELLEVPVVEPGCGQGHQCRPLSLWAGEPVVGWWPSAGSASPPSAGIT